MQPRAADTERTRSGTLRTNLSGRRKPIRRAGYIPDFTFSAEFVTAWPAALTSLPAPAVVLQALNSGTAPDRRARLRTTIAMFFRIGDSFGIDGVTGTITSPANIKIPTGFRAMRIDLDQGATTPKDHTRPGSGGEVRNLLSFLLSRPWYSINSSDTSTRWRRWCNILSVNCCPVGAGQR
jgi:hypothetical protein